MVPHTYEYVEEVPVEYQEQIMVPHTYEYVEEVVVPRTVEYQERKIYIGTYTNELEAAKVFDFYSILLNNITATTNFDYTKKDIIEMIENFVSNDGKYKPQ